MGKLVVKTSSIRRAEYEKETRPKGKWKLIKQRRGIFYKYVLIFERPCALRKK